VVALGWGKVDEGFRGIATGCLDEGMIGVEGPGITVDMTCPPVLSINTILTIYQSRSLSLVVQVCVVAFISFQFDSQIVTNIF
jgi:hypothetical protein